MLLEQQQLSDWSKGVLQSFIKPSVCLSASMESGLLIGWQQQKAELEQEVCRLQEELAESRADKEELKSRSRALNDRVRKRRRRSCDYQEKLTSHLSLSPAVPDSFSLARPVSARGGGAEEMQEEAEGGQGAGGPTGAADPPPAEQGEATGGAVTVTSLLITVIHRFW